jgi:hypothetical protein
VLLVGIVKAFPVPCILVQAELALKKEEALAQSQLGLDFRAGRSHHYVPFTRL